MIPRVRNVSVWGDIRILFVGSALLFLANVYSGFDNALSGEDIPRWQILVHLHAGTLGWITLSVIGIVLWVFTGERDVSKSYERGVKAMAWAGISIFGTYVLTFGLAFSQGGAYWGLLAIFGILSAAILWAAVFYAFTQLRRQPVVTTIHLLLTTGLLVAAIGSLMGVLLEFESIVGSFVPGDRIGLHVAFMDTYLALAASAIVEWFLRKDPAARWSRAGMAQTVAFGLIVVFGFPALLLGIMALLLPAIILILVGLAIFLGRIGWRALVINPLALGAKSWMFFGTAWLAFYGIFLVYIILAYPGGPPTAPHAGLVFLTHATFVGMMTSLLLGVYSARGTGGGRGLAQAEFAGMWLLNLGILLFFALMAFADSHLGAIVMGIGVLLGVFAVVARLAMGEGPRPTGTGVQGGP